MPLLTHVIAVVNISVTCILCISFVSIIIVWRSKKSERTIRNASTMCVPCDELQSPPWSTAVSYEDIERLRSTKNNSSCCASTDEIVKMQIKKKMDEQVYQYNSGIISTDIISAILGKDSCDVGSLNENVARAKIVGVADYVRSSFKSDHQKVRWNKYGYSVTTGDITHLEKEGEIFIRKAGTYVILSKLCIHRNASEPMATNFSHILFRLSHKHGSDNVLMQRRRTLCHTNVEQHDSLMSAVFRFDKHDRLSIHTTHAQHLNINDTENFFVAYYTYDTYD